MKIGAYQFAVTYSITQNMHAIRRAISLAAKESVRLLAFPECALTGYPKHDKRSSDVDFQVIEDCFAELRRLSVQYSMYLLVGSVTKNADLYHNSAVLFSPDGSEETLYSKRALWGWDSRNFTEGNDRGIWTIDEFRMGVRICFEVRFPEYFRELYREKTDFAVVMFNDVSETDDVERYELIKAHLQTRASENVCTVMSVNDASLYQTAPTAVIDHSGKVIAELSRNAEGLLLYDYQKPVASFSELGRQAVSDKLTKRYMAGE
jgi:predicted amidohydrolase